MYTDQQLDTTVAAVTAKTVSFYASQESGEAAVFHLLTCDLLEGRLMSARLDARAARQLAETILRAVGP